MAGDRGAGDRGAGDRDAGDAGGRGAASGDDRDRTPPAAGSAPGRVGDAAGGAAAGADTQAATNPPAAKPVNRTGPGANGRPKRRFGEKDRQAFLEHLAATCNASEAARSVGWPITTVHWNRRNDPAFAAAWKEATDAAYDRLEEALVAHALKAARPVEFDPDAVEIVIEDTDPATRREGKAGRFTVVGTQLALQLLGARAAAEQKGRRRPAHKRRATPDEVMTAINTKLDVLARKMGAAE